MFSPFSKPAEEQTTQTARDIFVAGLRNTRAMETQARELMERQSERLDEYPEVKQKVDAHLQETNEQLKRLEQCLEACGESTSSVKDRAQSRAANAMAMAHSMASDEILKNTFANNAFRAFRDRGPLDGVHASELFRLISGGAASLADQRPLRDSTGQSSPDWCPHYDPDCQRSF